MKTVVITGIDRGIGEALVEKFLKEGYEVVGTYLSGNVAPQENVTAVPLDLANSKSIESAAQTISGLGKKIDILINNAGAMFDEEDTQVFIDKLRKTLEVNLLGPIDFTERLISSMQDGSHIVNISSTAGSLERTGHALSHYPFHYPSYKISKAALNMYTRTLSLRLKNENITVSSVHPGWVKTSIGGEGAEMTSEEAALGIYEIAISRPETGGFWFKNERVPW